MEANERRDIELDLRNLVAQHNYFSDHGEREKAVDLFTPDGTWIRGGKPYTGRGEMLQSFQGGTAVMRHVLGNPLIHVKDADNAEAVTYYIALRHDPGTAEPKLPLPLEAPFSAGEWHDRFVRAKEGWRFARREVKRIYQRPGGH